MAHLQLIDLTLTVPSEAQVTTFPPEECRVVHIIDGIDRELLTTELRAQAASQGYRIRELVDGIAFDRGLQRIEGRNLTPTRMSWRVDDGESLPLSRVTAEGVAIGPHSFSLNRPFRAEPGRERHDAGSKSWRSEWKIYGKKPAQLLEELQSDLVAQGLRSNGLWTPAVDGIPQWTLEASTALVLVKAYATETPSYTDLIIVVVTS